MMHAYVDQIVVPRYDGPMARLDRGSTGRCLVEMRNASGEVLKQLVWFRGFMTAAAGVRGFGQVYVPARLYVLDRDSFLGDSIHNEGGRLSADLLRGLSTRIDACFGAGTTAAIRPRSTMVVTAG